MNNIYQFDDRQNKVERKLFDSGGGGGDNGDMEARVAKLEAVIPNLATKIDIADLRTEIARLETGMHKEFNAQTWKFITWMTGICTALIAATYFIAKH